jgi:hypothetical protein
MPYTIKLSLPNLPAGEGVAIVGINDALPNGKTSTISDEEAELFQKLNVHTNPDTGELISGPKLTEAFKGVTGVNVAYVKPAVSTEGGAN